MKIEPDKTTLNWQCPVCLNEASSFADSLVQSGTAVCPDCDTDMILDSVSVEVAHVATLFAFNNDGGRADGRQWALRFVDHVTGKSVTGRVSGGESNIYAILRHWGRVDDWDRSIQFVKICHFNNRQFDNLVKDWDYAGCTPDELVTYIKKNLDKVPDSV